MIKVSIIGANGYTGYELLRILANHSKVNIAYAASRSQAGEFVHKLYPSLYNSYPNLKFCEVDTKLIAKGSDIVFTALPHKTSAEVCAELIKYGIKVIDLSADFRYDDLSAYEQTYGVTHPCKELNPTAVYGLSEINRQKIKTANLIANPGCYTTCAILPLYPLLKNKVIGATNIIIDAKSGVSGAGRQAKEDFSFTELSGNFKAYGVTTHRHNSEIDEKLSLAADKDIKTVFTPHLLPIKRGILATIYADLIAGEKQVNAAYTEFYGNEYFVKVLPDLPDLKHIAGSNECRISYRIDKKTNKIVIVAALDNLVKGASGQAVQNMNIMCGFDEKLGLTNITREL